MEVPHNEKSGGFSTTELRAVEQQALRKKRALWMGYLTVALPLIILLGLQSLWLVDLQESSAIARRATFRNFVEAVTKEVHVFYLKISERALNIPPEIFTQRELKKAGWHFKKRNVKGVQRLFVVSVEEGGTIYFYDPEDHSMSVPDYSRETVAVWAAVAPWMVVIKKGPKVDTTTFSVDQRDPDYRIILNPITDEKSEVVGLAGLIVDQEFFVSAVLPKVLQTALPQLATSKGLEVAVRDQNGRQVLPTDRTLAASADVVRDFFGFVFTDWTIGLQGSLTASESWARTNFFINMTLSVILGIALVGGISLALRTASREMKLSAMKNDFVSNVSHELRTPLSSIRVFGEFLRLGRVSDPAKVQEYGEIIETESRRLTQLINNILDFSRIESGRRVCRFAPADLEEVVSETLSTFAVRLAKAGFTVELEGPEEPLPEMVMDSNAIGRAVANLLDNAVKYSDGNREIRVRLRRDGRYAAVSVTDHGIGIPKDEHERIFERFHRVSTGLVHDVKGSGLGLALVQHIAASHGGDVGVRSEPGKGSTFTLRIPLEATPEVRERMNRGDCP